MFIVTGAAGHIGNTLVRELLSKGENVRVLLHSKDNHSLNGLEVEKVVGDVIDPGSLLKAFKGCDVVFHIAGIISISRGHSKLLHQINVRGTQNVVKACMESGVERLVYTSSIHAILEPPIGVVIDETCPYDPYRTVGDYGKSKARASLEVLKAVRNGLDAVTLCPTGVVGPYDFKPSRMGQFSIDFARKKVIAYIDGAYDFVDVRDVAMAHILALEKGSAGESYIISGERITIRALMGMLEEITGVRSPRFKVPISLAKIAALFNTVYFNTTYFSTMSFSNTDSNKMYLNSMYNAIKNREPRFTNYTLRTLNSNSFISSAKARRELGYTPRPIRESIGDAISWFRENNRI